MSYYAIALFAHIVGALGFFVALGVEWIGARQLRRAATAEQAGLWVRVATSVRLLGMASMVTILVAGFYMMLVGQVGGAWLIVAFWAMVLLAVLAVALSFRPMAAIGRAASAETGPVSPALRQRLRGPRLWIGIQARVAIALGIVFLMTVKPGLVGSLLTIAVAALLGLGAALPTLSRARAREEPAT